MASKTFRSFLAGLTACLSLVIFTGCGTERDAANLSPTTWPVSTWRFFQDEDQQSGTVTIEDQFTFSGGNTGNASRTVSSGGQNTFGSYTYQKTGNNTGIIQIIVTGVDEDDNPIQIAATFNLTFTTVNGGFGQFTAPNDENFGGRVLQFTFQRVN